MKNLLFLTLILCISLGGCSTDENAAILQAPKEALALRQENGELILLKDFKETKQALIEITLMHNKIFEEVGVGKDQIELSNFSIEHADVGRAYMFFTLQAKGKSLNVAHELKEGFDGYYSSFGETHTCAGNPCSECDFLREEGRIVGCVCMAGGKCNHTVTTGELPIGY